MDRTPDAEAISAAISRLYREEWARIVAGLTRRFGDLDVAEEAAAEAFATAVDRWPGEGVPPNPGAWVTTTAHRRTIDRIRRESRRDAKHEEAFRMLDHGPREPVGAIEDDRLRLLFTCCHPALSLEAQVALTLRIVGGLIVAEIAHAFLVREATLGQRITRAKAKIKAARIPYQVPSAEDLPHRVAGVLAVLYLVFNEGYLASGPDAPPIRRELTGEAIRLVRLLDEVLPGEPEVLGLLALMLLTEARATARLSEDGELVRLDEQDRGSWDRRLIDEGMAIIDRHDTSTASGRYLLLAKINAAHASAPHARDTDWSRIIRLYGQLEQIDPSPIVSLNKAIAIAEVDSPTVGLAAMEPLGDQLSGYHAYHGTRAELLRAAGRSEEARAAYDRAIGLAGNSAESAHLIRRRGQLAARTDSGQSGSTTKGTTA